MAAWEVTAEDEQALDRYEVSHFYYKAEMKLPIKGIRSGKIRLETPLCTSCREPALWSKDFIRPSLEGYRSFGFDKTYLLDAIKQ